MPKQPFKPQAIFPIGCKQLHFVFYAEQTIKLPGRLKQPKQAYRHSNKKSPNLEVIC
jgi:hypothetical protein